MITPQQPTLMAFFRPSSTSLSLRLSSDFFTLERGTSLLTGLALTDLAELATSRFRSRAGLGKSNRRSSRLTYQSLGWPTPPQLFPFSHDLKSVMPPMPSMSIVVFMRQSVSNLSFNTTLLDPPSTREGQVLLYLMLSRHTGPILMLSCLQSSFYTDEYTAASVWPGVCQIPPES